MTTAKQQLKELLERRERLSVPEILPASEALPSRILSFGQQRLWFLQQYMGPNAVYNMPLALRLRGDVNEAALVRSLEELQRRHESLRTRFESRDGGVVQVIDPPALELEVEAVSAVEAQAIACWERSYHFDLSHERLCRIRLLRETGSDGDDAGDYVLLATMHHAVSDGWSLGVFFREFVSLYQAFAKGESSPLAPLPIQYADYAQWQRRWLQGEVLESQVSYWREQLKDLPPLLTLPSDRPRPAEQTFCGSTERFELPAALSEKLQALSREQGATLFMTMLSAFAVLLGRYSGQQDVAVGTPIANRTRRETEGLIGFFVNTLVMRHELSGDPRFIDFLKRTRDTALKAYAHQDVPFEQLVEQLNPGRSMSHSPLFQAMFVMHNASFASLELPGFEVQPLQASAAEEDGGGAAQGTARFDLTLSVQETPSGLMGGLEYNTDLFDRSTIRRMLDHFARLLEAVTSSPEAPLSALEMLNEEEKRQQLCEWNATAQPYPNDKCIHELFEEQAQRRPDAGAIAYERHSLSYADLNERANRLAHYLRDRGVRPEARVGICVERSPEMVIAMLGVLKAGGVYVPLDPGYPQQRFRHQLSDSAPLLVLADSVGRAVLADPALSVSVIDVEAEAPLWKSQCSENARATDVGLTSRHPAYVIYTSGSTGTPKGVVVEHRGLCNLARAQIAEFEVDESSRVLQFASLSFDASAWEIIMGLCSGATLYLPAGDQLLAGERLLEVLGAGITHATLPPAVLSGLAEHERLKDLRMLIVAGETCSQQVVESWAPGRQFVNAYGPTEATVCATVFRCDPLERGAPAIGRPISNAQIYVLDRHWCPQPIGVAGEIYIGGVGVARGYLNRKQFTAECFIPDPFGAERGSRLYRTGDFGRLLADGTLEYIGRIDTQVKVRGHRIELGEIESVLLAHEAVRDAVVVAREECGDKRLVGYVVAKSDAQTADASLKHELRSHLREHLPSYMMPSALMVLPSLPMTVTGKVDRQGLPCPDASVAESEYAPPAGATEELLAQLWCSLLKRERVGREENFFELGGHSLLATQLASRIRDTFATELPVRELFEFATLALQAAAIERARGAGALNYLPMEAVSREQLLPLSYAQQRLWFLHQYLGSNAVYNMPLALRLQGEVNEEALVRSLAELHRRHESLRTRFEVRDGSAVQVIDSPALELEVEPVSVAQAAAIAGSEGSHCFDLSGGKLCRIRLLRVTDGDGHDAGDYVLLVTTHHSVSDGWSLAVYFRELVSLYLAYAKGEGSPLAPLPIQYADYAQWQRRSLQGEMLESQVSYWRDQLKGLPSLLTLPTDRPRPSEQTYRGSTESFALPAAIARRLQAVSREQGATLYMTLLSAFAVLLGRYSGQQDVAVGTPIANRTRRETEALLGFFTNTLVMRHDLSGDPRFVDLLECTRATALQAYAHQDIPFELLVEKLNPERSVSHTPLFQVMFVLQNVPIEALELPGLKLRPLSADKGRADGEDGPEGTALFDLTLGVQETPAGLVGAAEFNTDLFDRATIRRMLDHYARLLEAIADAPQARISQLQILGDAERRRLLVDWNATAQPYPVDKCVHELFAEQADRVPEAIAVVDGPEHLTYAELNHRSNQLAHYLRAKGAGPERSVALYLERSKDVIVGLLAVLKAGAAYVPLDSAYPADRVAQVLNDAQPLVVLTHRQMLDRLSSHPPALCLDTDWHQVASQPINAPQTGACADHLAYVIYTSGSTGKSKGVQVSHRSLLNLVYGHSSVYLPDRGAGSKRTRSALQVALNASIAFDASVPEYLMLLDGATLHLVPEQVRALPATLARFLSQHRIDVFDCVPSQMKYLVEQLSHSPQLVMLGGEAVDSALWRQLSNLRTANACNLYGPTECTVDATCCPIDGTHLSPRIGRPLPNVQVYILDAHLQPVPVGVTGEIYIGGDGVARGYLNRPELTAERFVADPFGGRAGARLYRTGDLARWCADGCIEYLGRNDNQVKIRGYRIELGEIESVLLTHEGLRDAVVVVREEAENRRLVAYVVARADTQANEAALLQELRGRLQERLPSYMVPSAFVVLDSLPLTPNGKLDRDALPAPEENALAHRRYEAPQGPIECALAQLWQELLGIERVGRYDNFFELGGHSLLAVTLIERMRQQGLETDVRALYSSPTLSQLAEEVVRGTAAFRVPENRIDPNCERITAEMLPLVALEQEEIDRIVERVPGGVRNVQDIYPLAPLQEGILFHHLMGTEGDAYLSPQLFAFDSRQRLDQYLSALQGVIGRHDILRTGVQWEGLSQPVQVVWRQARLAVEEVELSSGDAAPELWERFDPQRYRLDIREAPLQKALVAFDRQHDRWLMLLLSHHLAIDHTSQEIIAAEVQSHLLGEQDRLAAPVPFREFVALARLGLSASDHEEFFRGMLADIDEPTAPFGWLDARGNGGGIAEAYLPVADEVASGIRRCARAAGVSAASLFHLAWAQALAQLTDRKEVVFGTVLFGRLSGAEGVTRGVGLFMNTLPLRVSIDEQSAQEALRSTHERLGQLLRHEHAALALAQRCSAVQADVPLFTTLLNYRYVGALAENEQTQQAWEGIGVLYAEERTNYPLMLSVNDLGEGFWLTVQVRDQVEPLRICELMHEALAGLVQALQGVAPTPMSAIAAQGFFDKTALLSDSERHRQLVEWNAMAHSNPQEKCIHELFEVQAGQAPDRIALVHEQSALTYGELNRRANRLAHRLREGGVGPETRVGICVERGLSMVIGLLGILKAGGTYVPLDPGYPRKRLSYLLADSEPVLLLTDAVGRAAFADQPIAVAMLDLDADVDAARLPGPAAENPAGAGLRPDHMAYLIYTSGSTGKPKGVMVEHRQVTRLFATTTEWFRFGEQDVWSLFHSMAFDFSVWEIWGALLHGGRLVVVPQAAARSPEDFYELMCRERISMLNQTPSAFMQLIHAQERRPRQHALRRVIFGGEALQVRALERWYDNNDEQQPLLVNMYGITETCVHVTYQALRKADTQGLTEGSPIGVRLPDLRAYLLDQSQQLVPIGVAGEIYVGGAGVARGYFNRPELTAARFVPDPFSTEPGARLYKAGDLGRFRADGSIEYLGRNDEQVKVRGYRIELGEIESLLLAHEAVRDAAVLAVDESPGSKRLVGYVVAEAGAQADEVALIQELRSRLQEQLPGYMVPSVLMVLERLPLTANGKLDRKALPMPEALESESEYVPPKGPTEELLAQLWCSLLRRERVGRHDNFFELGGHSLLAMQLASRIRDAFSTELPVRELFEHAVLSSQARAVESRRGAGAPVDLAMEVVSRDRPLPLSHAQQRLWFLHQYLGPNAIYNIPLALRLRGETNEAALVQSLEEMHRRHESLRTRFESFDGSAVQVIDPPGLELEVELVSATEAQAISYWERSLHFDLSRERLCRVRLLRETNNGRGEPGDYVLLVTMHHSVSDGWSLGVFFREFVSLYQAYANGEESPLAPLPIQYADYAQWQRRWLQGEVLEGQVSYWREQLKDLPPLLTLPTDRPRPSEQTFRGSMEDFVLPVALTERLRALSREQGATLYMTLLSAFAVLLGRYAGQQDVAVGTPIANRTRRETEGLIGLFANTLVMRHDLSGDPRFIDLLKGTRATALEAYAHQDVPFEQLVEKLNPERSLSHTPLFQVMFVLQNMPFEALELPGLAVQPQEPAAAEAGGESPEGVARFDLTLSMQETQSGLAGGLEYNTDLFDRGTVRRMLDHYARLLEAIVASPRSRLSRLQMMGDAEKRQQLIEWNATARAYPEDQCIHELFEAQARQTPDRIALIHEGSELTYDELNRRANQLAHRLIERGVGPEVRVGICLRRSPQMLIGLLAILKSGGCYVPLDPGYPRKRLTYLLEDSAVELVVCDREVEESLDLVGLAAGARGIQTRIVSIDGGTDAPDEHACNPATAVNPANLAYLIYTSGSTGQPKGVGIAHRGAVSLLSWSAGQWPGSERAGVLASTSICFDLSIYELFLPLTHGGECLLLDSILDFSEMAQRERVSLINTVPSAAKSLLERGGLPASLKVMNLAGEPLKAELVDALYESGAVGVVYDLYGPSESTTYSTYALRSVKGRETIGRPVSNTQAYVLDGAGELLPRGVVGELYLGGAGLARGYLNRPVPTAEKFVPNIFAKIPGERLYRTGDLARWMPDGTLEYLGRADTQVKVRGYRIELGEIESLLLAHEAVRDAAVVAVDESPGSKRLVGYVVAEAGAQADEVALIQELRGRLQDQLPGYMVPSVLMVLERLPLTANGKLDRKALPRSEASSQAEYAPPEGVTEKLLAEIWGELLRRERVGRHDNFFELGGHSLLAMQLASRIRDAFSTELPLRELFEHAVLSSQARAVESRRGADAPVDLAMEVVSRDRPLPLSHAQQRLWFLHQYLGPNAIYNIPLALRLRGETNEAALVQSLEEMCRRHESLRTRFEAREDGAVQVIDPPGLDLTVEAVSAAEAESIAGQERAHHFDLSRERLCRVRLLRETNNGRGEPGDYVLLVTMHHSVSDGWSLGVFFREFVSLYQAYANGEESPLAPLPIQYADYAQWQRRWLQGEVLEGQVSYWREQLKDLPPLLTLPTDRPRPSEQTFRGSMEDFVLPVALTERLRALSREQGATLYMTLLSAFAVLLGRYAGQQDVAVGTPIANRTRRETEGLIGLFANTLVMRHDLSGDPRFIDLLKGTRATALEAYAHQDVPFEQLVEKLNPERSLSHTPLFQVMFVLQNMPFEALELPGLAVQPQEPAAAEAGGESPEGVARFDLTLSMQETQSGLVGGLEYNTDLFDRGTVRRMLDHYARLLEAIVASPRSRLSRLQMMGDAEKRQQLIEWNATARAYPEDQCIHELFEAQARQTPDRIALIHEGSELTYDELNRRANQLAHRLIERGVGPEVRVGLCMPRSMEMVIGILGILKAGGAYVPLDPNYPRRRLEFLLEDAQIALVVTEPGAALCVAGPGRDLLLLDATEALESSARSGLDVDVRATGLRPDHPAYLIYTSASTGTPKGVLGLHRSIVNRVNWLAGTVGVGVEEVLCQKTSPGFVDHVAEIFQALSAGVPLVIISPPVLQAPNELLRELDARRVTQLTLVPSLLKAVLESGQGERARWLKAIHSSGEALHLAGLENFSQCFPQARLFNIYGSTEMGADVTCQEVAAESLRPESAGQWVPIGKVIDNTQAYVLDANGQLTVAGAVGELHVGGVCLARGYCRHAALTAEKFVPSVFARAPGERLYRTGDLARWRADGTLEYLGRIDNQVKVRGHRVELEEIESVLRGHEAVRDAVVTARADGGDQRLVSYVVAKAGVQVDESALIPALRGRLQEQLPSYMVPSTFVMLGELPLTATGKLDRRALPAPGGDAHSHRQYVAPEGEIELALAQVWQSLLRVERVGRHDNIFELGAHSLLVLQACSVVRKELGVELKVYTMFANPSVALLATQISLLRDIGNSSSNPPVPGVADDVEEGTL